MTGTSPEHLHTVIEDRVRRDVRLRLGKRAVENLAADQPVMLSGREADDVATVALAALRDAGMVVVPAGDVRKVLNQRTLHAHATPGVWDDGNGDRAGQPCVECAARDRLTAAIETGQPTTAKQPAERRRLRRAGSPWRLLVHEWRGSQPDGTKYGVSHHVSNTPVGGPASEWRRDHVIEGTEFDELVVGRWIHVEQMGTRAWWMNIGGLTINIGVDRDGRPRDVDVYGPGDYADPVEGVEYHLTWRGREEAFTAEPTPQRRSTIEEKIEASSLGTPAAKAARDSIQPERAAAVVARAKQLSEEGRT